MKMLFILGCRRSATTALQTQVQAHPSVHYFNGGVLPEGRGRNEFHLFDLVDTAPAEYEALFRHHCGRAPSGDVTADAEAIFARCTRPVGLVKSTRLLMSARPGIGSRPGPRPPRIRCGCSASSGFPWRP